jgi:hypothetical protein
METPTIYPSPIPTSSPTNFTGISPKTLKVVIISLVGTSIAFGLILAVIWLVRCRRRRAGDVEQATGEIDDDEAAGGREIEMVDMGDSGGLLAVRAQYDPRVTAPRDSMEL